MFIYLLNIGTRTHTLKECIGTNQSGYFELLQLEKYIYFIFWISIEGHKGIVDEAGGFAYIM